MVPTKYLWSVCICVLALGACSTTGNMERNALIGAGLGAGTGAIIGNNTGSGDASTGALIGGLVGGAGGAHSGYVQDQRYYNRNQQYGRPQLYFDQRYRRYFYVDPYSGRTYWQNGEYRY
ncbi:MAG: hypothetical protein EX271_11245 [Acidimicrobiales bacterium]|nr:hypothetical protein [Hyphomonadaceae bacterium]RZV38047.1 MAG: hypothetical protein EX271_11245 [Acidimicrobiales bacterium]